MNYSKISNIQKEWHHARKKILRLPSFFLEADLKNTQIKNLVLMTFKELNIHCAQYIYYLNDSALTLALSRGEHKSCTASYVASKKSIT
jgi:hypothetical protein